MPGKHGPNWLENYLAVHERAMADLLDEGFVVEDRSEFTFLSDALLLQGEILCLDSIKRDYQGCAD